MFRSDSRYTAFTEEGIPLRCLDASGAEVDVSKNATKKLRTEWETRRKLNEKYASTPLAEWITFSLYMSKFGDTPV